MSFANLPLIPIILTLAAVTAIMWLVRSYFAKSRWRHVLTPLSGLAFLFSLHWLGVPAAGYILVAMAAIYALVFALRLYMEM